MKRLFASVLVLIALVTTLSVSAFGYDWISDTIIVDFSNNYIIPMADGAVTLRYNVKNLFYSVRASTDVSVSNDATGMAYISIRALNNEISSSSGYTKSGNIINSGIATVAGQEYAKETNHFADRTTGSDRTCWDYYCE